MNGPNGPNAPNGLNVTQAINAVIVVLMAVFFAVFGFGIRSYLVFSLLAGALIIINADRLRAFIFGTANNSIPTHADYAVKPLWSYRLYILAAIVFVIVALITIHLKWGLWASVPAGAVAAVAGNRLQRYNAIAGAAVIGGKIMPGGDAVKPPDADPGYGRDDTPTEAGWGKEKIIKYS